MRYLYTVIILALMWEFLPVFADVQIYIMPRLSVVLKSFYENWNSIYSNGIVSFKTILLAYTFAILTAIPLAIVSYQIPRASALLDPPIVISQLIPRIALIPIIAIWFGMNSQTTKVIIAVIMAYFPIYDGLREGLSGSNRDLTFQATLIGKSRINKLLFIELPMASGHLFSGLRTATLMIVTGVIVAEFLVSGDGLGYKITNAMRKFETPEVFAYILATTILGVSLYLVVAILGYAIKRKLRLNI